MTHLVRQRIEARTSVDLDNVTSPGQFGVKNPTNGPAAGTFSVEVFVTLDGATRLIVQRAINMADGTVSTRFHNGTVWSAWA